MASVEQLKATAQAAIEARRDWLIDVARTVLNHPEPGFHEVKTSALVSQKLHELGIAHDRGIAITGLKGSPRLGCYQTIPRGVPRTMKGASAKKHARDCSLLG